MNEANYPQELKKLLESSIAAGASDLHITVGVPSIIRVDGRLVSLPHDAVFTEERVKKLITAVLLPKQIEKLTQEREIDFSFSFGEARIRANIYHQRGAMAASFRFIPRQIRNLQDLNLPPILERFTQSTQGLVIIAGPTGHGKSTTLAALVELINESRSDHIITIEDPIEYVFEL